MSNELEPVNADRDVIVRAAQAYDATQRLIEDLRHANDKQAAAMEAQTHAIAQLELLLSQERNHVQTYKAERDEVVAQMADLKALLAQYRGRIEGLARDFVDAEIPLPKPRARRSNGKFVAANEQQPDTLATDLAAAVSSVEGGDGNSVPVKE